jgi:hypothetical protein
LGIGVPPELLQASETGSGYSGREIPLEGYFLGQQLNATAIMEAFVRQVVTPLVRWRFGPDAKFRVKVKSLLETRKAQARGPQQPPGQNPQQPPDDESDPSNVPPQNPPTNGNPKPPGAFRLATEAKADQAVPTASVSSAMAAQARVDMLAAIQSAEPGDWFSVILDVLDRYKIRFTAALRNARLAALLLGAREVSRAALSAAPPASGGGSLAPAPPNEVPPWTPEPIGDEHAGG